MSSKKSVEVLAGCTSSESESGRASLEMLSCWSSASLAALTMVSAAGLVVLGLEKSNLFLARVMLIGCSAGTRGPAVAADEAPKCAGNAVSMAAPAAV